MGEGDDPDAHVLERGSVLVVQPGTRAPALEPRTTTSCGSSSTAPRRSAAKQRFCRRSSSAYRTKRAIRAAISSPSILLQEVAAARDDLRRERAGDVRGHPLGVRGGEDAVGVGEQDERRLLPARERVAAPRASPAADGWSGSVGTSSGNASAPAFASATGNGAS